MTYCFYWVSKQQEINPYWTLFFALLEESVFDEGILGFEEKSLEEKNSSYSKYKKKLEVDLDSDLLDILLVFQDSTMTNLIATCQVKKSLQDTSKHISDIQKGIIQKKHRGTKVLNLMFLEVAKRCLSQGVELLTLDVRKNSRAHKMWIYYGFKQYGTLEDYSRFEKVKYEGSFLFQKSKDLLHKCKSIEN